MIGKETEIIMQTIYKKTRNFWNKYFDMPTTLVINKDMLNVLNNYYKVVTGLNENDIDSKPKLFNMDIILDESVKNNEDILVGLLVNGSWLLE